ncbi:unnamed protein product [Closterium sp. NIES-65]|nr:unnamed protein product [Closterium sp. NIES-65]
MPHLYPAACPSPPNPPPPSQLFACAAAVAVGERGRTGRDWRPNQRASQLAPRPSPVRHPHLHDPSLPRLHLPRQQLAFHPVPALSLPLPVPPSSRLPPLPRLPMPCWAVVALEDSGGGGGGNGGSGGVGGSCGGVGEAWGIGVVGACQQWQGRGGGRAGCRVKDRAETTVSGAWGVEEGKGREGGGAVPGGR